MTDESTAGALPEAVFLEAVRRYFELPDPVSLESRLVDDLCLDSIAVVELLVFVEDAIGHELAPEATESVDTLGAVYHFYLQGKNAGSNE